MMYYTPLVVTDRDAVRIRELGKRLPDAGRGLPGLRDLVERVDAEAEIVPGTGVPADVVTMNSIVSFKDEETGHVSRVSLVYPADMSIADHRISVLSPVGRALLGRSGGAGAEGSLPDGSARRVRIRGSPDQPEAAGDC
ncbi:MAG: GreA/GreB family elongation factor, partial [Burkholderiales bacterium]|nr:GreA/GreB family elongation factor [Burkholderiales bacterium]